MKTVIRIFVAFVLPAILLGACGPTVNPETGRVQTTDYSTIDLLNGKGPTTSLSQPDESKYPNVGGGDFGLGWPYEVRPLTFNDSQIIILAKAIVVQPDTKVDKYNFYLPNEVALMEAENTLTLTFGANILRMTTKGAGNNLDLESVTYQGELSQNQTIYVGFMSAGEYQYPYLMPESMAKDYHEAYTAGH